jgi:uncharacterized protein (TIGR00266 family)
MADQVDYHIDGNDLQAVTITLDPGEAVRAEPGAFMWMENGIEMSTSTGGGMLAGIKRKLSGETFFITAFTNEGHDRRQVAFAGPFPGRILPVDLSRGDLLCQRDAYLCSAMGIDVTLALHKKLGAGFFGGEGFFLQRLSGEGLAFVHAGGHIVEHELGAGESVKVDTGCLVAFEESVAYDIQRIKGVKSMLFGGEGLFYALMRGPGKVWLQTTPFSRLANRIVSAAGGSKGQVRRGGGVLGDLLGGD